MKIPDDILFEKKITTNLSKNHIDNLAPNPAIQPKHEKSKLPSINRGKGEVHSINKKNSKTGKVKNLGNSKTDKTGRKEVSRYEFIKEPGGKLQVGVKYNDIKYDGIMEKTGGKSKKSIRIIVYAFVNGDGSIQSVEFGGAIGVMDLEQHDLDGLIKLALDDIRSKPYEPSNEALRKFTEEVDFSYMGF